MNIAKLEVKKIDGETVQTVDARDWRTSPDIKRNFSKSIRAKIKPSKLVQSRDFITTTGQCPGIRVVSKSTDRLCMLFALGQDPQARFTHSGRHSLRRHLSSRYQAKGFKQQGEPIGAPSKGRLNQSHQSIRQLYTRCGHLQMTLLLKVVQGPLLISHCVVHRMSTTMTQFTQATACLDVDQHRQSLGAFTKLHRRSAQWISDSQRSFNKWRSSGTSAKGRQK